MADRRVGVLSASFPPRVAALSALLVLLCAIGLQSAQAAPAAKLWERWTAHDPNSRTAVDHRAWDNFLKTYVLSQGDGVNRLDYGGVSRADRQRLDRYVGTLAATPVSELNRTEQRAYWINLYNALTVKVILDAYPVRSIRDIDISPGFFADGPWGKKLLTIEGEAVALDDIEHRILRPIWRDPRIHYAVNCASIGCPNLRREAATAANAEAYLDAGARDYVNHPRGSRVKDGRLVVSSIYEWFQDDFGGGDAGVISHLRRYAKADLAAALGQVSKISDDVYDWALNDTSPQQSKNAASGG